MLSINGSWHTLLSVLLLTSINVPIRSPVKETLSTAQEDRTARRAIKSVVVDVVGESFMGVKYSKRIVVTNKDSNSLLDYSCFRCKCRSPKVAGKKLESGIAEQFLKLIESLEDGGKMASCCDHPYTEVEITYGDGSVKKLVLSFDLGKGGTSKEKEIPGVEKMLHLECDMAK